MSDLEIRTSFFSTPTMHDPTLLSQYKEVCEKRDAEMAAAFGIPVELWAPKGNRTAAEAQAMCAAVEMQTRRVVQHWSDLVRDMWKNGLNPTGALKRLYRKRDQADQRISLAYATGRRRRAKKHHRDFKRLCVRIQREEERSSFKNRPLTYADKPRNDVHNGGDNLQGGL